MNNNGCVDLPISQLLIKKGWVLERPNGWTLRKKNWTVTYDTGSWIEVGTDRNPRVFDVPMPELGEEAWTVSLIEHLCKCDDALPAKPLGIRIKIALYRFRKKIWNFIR